MAFELITFAEGGQRGFGADYDTAVLRAIRNAVKSRALHTQLLVPQRTPYVLAAPDMDPIAVTVVSGKQAVCRQGRIVTNLVLGTEFTGPDRQISTVPIRERIPFLGAMELDYKDGVLDITLHGLVRHVETSELITAALAGSGAVR